MALLEGAPMLVAQPRRRYARSSPHPSAKTISAPPPEPRWRATDEASVLHCIADAGWRPLVDRISFGPRRRHRPDRECRDAAAAQSGGSHRDRQARQAGQGAGLWPVQSRASRPGDHDVVLSDRIHRQAVHGGIGDAARSGRNAQARRAGCHRPLRRYALLQQTTGYQWQVQS